MKVGGDILFNKIKFQDFAEQRRRQVLREVETLTEDYLLNVNSSDLLKAIVAQLSLSAPTITEEIEIDDYGESKNEQIFVRNIEYVLPFQGDHAIFDIQPPEYSTDPPIGFIDKDVIRVRFIVDMENPLEVQEMRSRFQQNLKNIQWYLQSIKVAATNFNEELQRAIQEAITKRKNRILKARSTLSSLGFPLKKREGVFNYPADVVRRALPVELPKASSGPFQPEPELLLEHYEHILEIIHRMGRIIEYNPNAFSTMDEETLRTMFLVQLNGHYEGQATGETFNFEGKTDILIRASSRNIFIAECKKWKGPATLLESVDQILGYLSWRDTKAAIIIFNHNKGFSDVVSQVPKTMRNHTNYKKKVDYASESGFRFIFHQRDDINREVILTVILFNIPLSISN